jgi:hypothetical protein
MGLRNRLLRGLIVAKISYQTIFGAIILIFGILLLFRTTGIYDTGQLLRYIPSLFVLLGIYALWKTVFPT